MFGGFQHTFLLQNTRINLPFVSPPKQATNPIQSIALFLYLSQLPLCVKNITLQFV